MKINKTFCMNAQSDHVLSVSSPIPSIRVFMNTQIWTKLYLEFQQEDKFYFIFWSFWFYVCTEAATLLKKTYFSGGLFYLPNIRFVFILNKKKIWFTLKYFRHSGCIYCWHRLCKKKRRYRGIIWRRNAIILEYRIHSPWIGYPQYSDHIFHITVCDSLILLEIMYVCFRVSCFNLVTITRIDLISFRSLVLYINRVTSWERHKNNSTYLITWYLTIWRSQKRLRFELRWVNILGLPGKKSGNGHGDTI